MSTTLAKKETVVPKNTLGRNCMTRLHLYKGAEHPHAAQKPEAWTLD